jgi:hypothetical protein
MATSRKPIPPRGIRNNNPLNIRIGNVWLGEVQENTDLEFEQFVSMEYGLRAAFVLLRRYIKHYKLNTINKIIQRWAPSNENNTSKYSLTVCKRTGISGDEIIDFYDRDVMCSIVKAMAYVECGVELDDVKLREGYALA